MRIYKKFINEVTIYIRSLFRSDEHKIRPNVERTQRKRLGFIYASLPSSSHLRFSLASQKLDRPVYPPANLYGPLAFSGEAASPSKSVIRMGLSISTVTIQNGHQMALTPFIERNHRMCAL
jgi:hypothetical protein